MKGNCLTRAFYSGVRTLKKDSTTILTACAVVGVVGTFITTIQATDKSTRKIQKEEKERFSELSKAEKLKLVWKNYIPPVIIGTSTIVCIVSANALNQKRQAELTSAYVALDQAYKEYKRRVSATFGEEAQNDIFKTAYNEAKEANNIPEDDDDDTLLFYDEYSNRYFRMKSREFSDANAKLNDLLALKGCVSLNDLYFYLGLEPDDAGYELGWNWFLFDDYDGSFSLGHGPVDLNPCVCEMDDGLEAYILVYDPAPESDYWYRR